MATLQLHRHQLPDSAGQQTGQEFKDWVALVRKRSGKCPASSGAPPRRLPMLEASPPDLPASPSSPCPSMAGQNSDYPIDNSANSNCPKQVPSVSLHDRLGNAEMIDIDSSDFSWENLVSLHHIKHANNDEHFEDELNKALEVTVNSGGLVFYTLFRILNADDLSVEDAAAVIKIAPSRMATQSERLGYEFAKWIGVKTPQARLIHNSSNEWLQIKDAVEKARDKAVADGDEVGEITCSELLEALELSRCLFLMNYVHGSPLLENLIAFDSRDAAETTAAALGRVFLLDLILRNEDRLPCRHLGWRGNYANLLFANKVASGSITSIADMYNSIIGRYKPQIPASLQKGRRAISVSARLGSPSPKVTSDTSDAYGELSKTSKGIQTCEEKNCQLHIVAIDSGVPRRPPAGKRIMDQENYPKLVELIINNMEYCSSLLYEISSGKLGFPEPEDTEAPKSSSSCLSESDIIAAVQAFRGGFRAALRDLQGFHLFLLTLYQKLEGLLRVYLSIINKSFAEPDKDDYGFSESPCHSASSSSLYPACKEPGENEARTDSSDPETQRCFYRSSGSRESLDQNSPVSKENWNGRYNKGSDSRNLRLTMKLRDFNKLPKIDAELSKELNQWNDMLRADVIKLCQDNNFNTGFFEGNDNNTAVDAYELKVRLEHILERIGLVSDAASTERPSCIMDHLYIGGALAAKSIYTLRHLGITHILCLCSNEIGQSDTQYPDLFRYWNFSVCDSEDEDISNLFEEASDSIDYVEYVGGKVLVHCFEGRSRSATVVLAYLMLRKGLSLLEAWNRLKKVHRRAQPNDGFAKMLLNLEMRLHGKTSMEWKQKKPTMKVCPICGKYAGICSSSLKLHLQKSHRKLSSGSVDSAMTLEIQKALEALKIISRSGSVSVSPTH